MLERETTSQSRLPMTLLRMEVPSKSVKQIVTNVMETSDTLAVVLADQDNNNTSAIRISKTIRKKKSLVKKKQPTTKGQFFLNSRTFTNPVTLENLRTTLP